MSTFSNFILLCFLFNYFKLEVEAIVGGSKALEKEFPFQVSIQVNHSHNCGGSILNEDLVLTARHCIHGKNLRELTIVAGDVHLSSVQYRSTHVIEGQPVILAPSRPAADDLALLKVNPVFNFTDGFRDKVHLPTADFVIKRDEKLYISGWGLKTVSPRLPSLSLKKAKVYAVEQCNPPYDGDLCTVHKKSFGNKGVCKGDSGGPLTYKKKLVNKDVQKLLVGVIAGSGHVNPNKPNELICGSKQYPDRHVKVVRYLNWIRGAAQQLNTGFPL